LLIGEPHRIEIRAVRRALGSNRDMAARQLRFVELRLPDIVGHQHLLDVLAGLRPPYKAAPMRSTGAGLAGSLPAARRRAHAVPQLRRSLARLSPRRNPAPGKAAG